MLRSLFFFSNFLKDSFTILGNFFKIKLLKKFIIYDCFFVVMVNDREEGGGEGSGEGGDKGGLDLIKD